MSLTTITLADGTNIVTTGDDSLLAGTDQDVSLDQSEYIQGNLATVTVTDAPPGEVIEFQATVISDPGPDGVYGTGDDMLSPAPAATFFVANGAGFTAGTTVVNGAAPANPAPDGSGAIQTTFPISAAYAGQTVLVTAQVVNVDQTTGAVTPTGPATSVVFEDPAPPGTTGAVLNDLTVASTTLTVNGAIFSNDIGRIGGGSGVLDPFVRVQADGTEQGYNTDGMPQLNTKGGTFTHAISLAQIPIIFVGGKAYRLFELDINQSNSSPLLSLDAFQLWADASPSLTDYQPGAHPDQGTGSFPATDNATLLYNMDQVGGTGASSDQFVALNSNIFNQGSGTIDLDLLVPVSQLQFDPTKPWLYLYTAFGYQGSSYVANSTFEEWQVLSGASLVSISGHKYDDLNQDGKFDNGDTPLSGWTVFIDVNNDGTFEPGTDISTITAADGSYTFSSLFPEPTFVVREVTQTGWTESAPAGNSYFITTLTSGGLTSTGNDFFNFALVTKSGEKFNDLNANGALNSGEPK